MPAYGILKRVPPLMVLAMAAPAALFRTRNCFGTSPCGGLVLARPVHRNFCGTQCAVRCLTWAAGGHGRSPRWPNILAVLAVGRLSFSVYLEAAPRDTGVTLWTRDGDGIELNVVNFLRACGMVMLYSYVFGLLLYALLVELPVAAVIRRLQELWIIVN
ncbi:hypothetical protein pipiens_008973 [Culex pipiens pipiens]|uniref:Uncharacterized protein n=1 Tax=Culex pipiens pipiens TaxID=38569 RepID=A0ABD1DHG0_CULPP